LTPKARRTRERIFEVALGLFGERGYEATTMRDIARAAGASVGLTYRYYASKEVLSWVPGARCGKEDLDRAISLGALLARAGCLGPRRPAALKDLRRGRAGR